MDHAKRPGTRSPRLSCSANRTPMLDASAGRSRGPRFTLWTLKRKPVGGARAFGPSERAGVARRPRNHLAPICRPQHGRHSRAPTAQPGSGGHTRKSCVHAIPSGPASMAPKAAPDMPQAGGARRNARAEVASGTSSRTRSSATESRKNLLSQTSSLHSTSRQLGRRAPPMQRMRA